MLNHDALKFLNHLPYHLSFYNKDLQLVYSNNYSGDNLFLGEEPSVLPEWIWEALQNSSDHSLHTQLPIESFGRILIQSYQLLHDEEGICLGVCSYIQDLKPLLTTYLKETGQAIVGWSDTTSGASISDHQFDDD
ncbi:sodium transporter [Streptococcus dentasini]